MLRAAIKEPPRHRDRQALGDFKRHPGRRMSEAEFVEWIDGKTRAEWVDGEVVLMPPDNLDHADFGGWLYAVVRAFVTRRSLGAVYGPNVMIRLPRQRRRRIPDLLFVAKGGAARLHKNYIEGPPDLIVEI